ncbi:MAG TPA: hypothetical protein VGO47_01890 [Chlamydiales bacterium]|nr:hypothetical protein [Chlamydiales bacterium]
MFLKAKPFASLGSTHHVPKRRVHSTVNADEIAHFSKLSSEWWNELGEFRILHRMNPIRMQYIVDKLHEVDKDEKKHLSFAAGNILSGMDVLDVGCGGGLLSEV